ncbi:MAG: hypothetical protein NTX64_14565 [Elusimicrobia bacterium]|nr:hypothetical protein [Elusimicrobiota bacterium]
MRALMVVAAMLAAILCRAQDIPTPMVQPSPGGGVPIAVPGAAPGGVGPGSVGPADVTLRPIVPSPTLLPVLSPTFQGPTGTPSSIAGSPSSNAPASAATAGRAEAAGRTSPAAMVSPVEPNVPAEIASPSEGPAPRAAENGTRRVLPAAPQRAEGGPGAGPVRNLDVTVQALQGAKKAEIEGAGGAVGSTLYRLYDAQTGRPALAEGSPIEEGTARQLQGLAPIEQVRKLGTIAESAAPTDAPALYSYAASIAADKLAQAEGKAEIEKLNASAGQRSEQALRGVAQDAIEQAHAGALKGKRLSVVEKAIDSWNAAAYLSGLPSLSNADQLKAAVAQLQQAAAAGDAGTSPKVRFVKENGDAASPPRLRAEIRGLSSKSTTVEPVPYTLARSFAVEGAETPRLDWTFDDPLRSGFRLEPPAGSGSRAIFREHRARGDSMLESLWAASTYWVRASLRGLWRRVVAFLRRALETVGLAAASPRLAPALRVEADGTALAALRRGADASEPIILYSPARRAGGYEVGPADQKTGAGLRLYRDPAVQVPLAEARTAGLEGIVGRRALIQPNALLRVAGGGELAALDLSERPAARQGKLVSPAWRALAQFSLSREPIGSFVVRDQVLWARLDSPAGAAELYADLTSPRAGGMLRARFYSPQGGEAGQARLYFVARALYDLGLAVHAEGGMVSAAADREHSAPTPDEMEERVPVLLSALRAGLEFDAARTAVFEGAASREEIGRRVGDLAGAMRSEGVLPFLKPGRPEETARAYGEYRGGDREREALRPALNRTLRTAGLAEVPASWPIGRRTIELWFNRPVESALARGDLRLAPDGRTSAAQGRAGLSALAEHVRSDPAAAARLAAAVGEVGLSAFRPEALGLAGGLVAERGLRRLGPGRWLAASWLREPGGNTPLFAAVESAEPGRAARAIDAKRLLESLDAEAAEPRVGAAELRAFAAQLAHASALLDRRALRARGAFASGATLAQGRGRPVAARLTYDPAKARQGGAIFVSPYAVPADKAALAASRGVVFTSGFGSEADASASAVPTLVLPSAEWTEAGLNVETLRLAAGERLARVETRTPVILREGSVVRLDPARGRLELVPREAQAAALRAAEALAAYDHSADVDALVRWADAQMSDGSLGELEKLQVGEELLAGADARARTALRKALVRGLGPATVTAIEARN